MQNQKNPSLINYHPLTATSDTNVDVAIALMHQYSTSYLVVLANAETAEESPVIGLFTEREIIQITASKVQLNKLPLAAVINRDLVTIDEAAAQDLFTINSFFREYKINYLPVLGKTGNCVGIITRQSIQDNLNTQCNQQLVQLQKLAEQQATELQNLSEQLQAEINHRQLAENKFYSAEAKMRTVLEAMTDLLMVINLQENQIKDIEIIPSNLNDLPHSNELIDCSLELFLSENANTWLEKIQESLLKKQKISLDYNLLWSEEEYWFTATISPISENAVLWVARDITARKQAEQALQHSKTTLATAQRVAHIGSWEFDVVQEKVTWSEELFHIFGLEPNQPEPTFTEHKQLIYPEDGDDWYQIVNDSLQTGNSYTQIFRIIHPNGEIRYIESRGEAILNDEQKVIKLYGTAMDITERKQAEIALRKSEEKFRAIFNQAIQFIGLLQPDGIILEINQTALDFAGISREEAIGKPFWQTKWWTISSETQTELNLAIAAAAAGAFMRYEVDVIGKDNQTVTIDFSLRPISNPQGQVTLLIAEGRDISDRKVLEHKLALREALLNDFFYSAPVGLCIIDEELRYIKINQQLAELNGLPVSEHIGKNLYQVLPEIASSLVPLYQQVLITKEPTLNIEIKGEVPSQPGVIRDWIVSLFPIPGEDGHSHTVGSVVVEITERKQAEKALRESAKREQALTQVIQKIRKTLELPEIFSATTTELQQLLDCDRVTIYRFNNDWTGEFVAESVADNWKSLIEVQQQNPQLTTCILNREECIIKKLYQNDIENRATNYLAVADIYQSDLTNCHIEILERFQAKAYLTVPIFCGNQFWGLLSVYQNSHSRKWQKSEINVVLQIGTQLAVALQQAELLSQTQRQSLELMTAKEVADAANYAKSQFLAKMSHELRTPLNAILGFSQIMVRSNSVSSEQKEHLEIINRSGEHLLNLINDILSMAKIESGQITLNESSFNLPQLLRLLKDMLWLKADSKGLELNFLIAPEIPENIQTDESKLRQVLLNLLGNAIKFTQKGSVSLTVVPAQLEPQKAENVQIIFTIKDTGPGICPSEISTLFQPFAQTQTGRQTGQGTGLGLAISQQFVKLMGGEITVESQLGFGSIFTFNILAKLSPETEKNLSFNTQQIICLEPNQPTYRILVVEDIKENRQLLVKLLTPLGFQVKEAENGQEAIKIWETWQPHLIWMDMRMPVMDGYEATQIIKAHPLGKNTIIIALTASVFEEQQPAILKAGCNDFLPKPFRSEVLLEKMAKYLGIRYVYADNSLSKFEHYQALELTPENLNVMSQEWIKKLHQAAAAVDDQLIMELVQELPENHINLANSLIDLVNNFRLDIIFKITEQCLKK